MTRVASSILFVRLRQMLRTRYLGLSCLGGEARVQDRTHKTYQHEGKNKITTVISPTTA